HREGPGRSSTAPPRGWPQRPAGTRRRPPTRPRGLRLPCGREGPPNLQATTTRTRSSRETPPSRRKLHPAPAPIIRPRCRSAGRASTMVAPVPIMRPFRALHYDPAVVDDLGAVICPPYDVISRPERARLLARHPRNAVRIELPVAPGDPS